LWPTPHHAYRRAMPLKTRLWISLAVLLLCLPLQAQSTEAEIKARLQDKPLYLHHRPCSCLFNSASKSRSRAASSVRYPSGSTQTFAVPARIRAYLPSIP
jgi:hypothetical protein